MFKILMALFLFSGVAFSEQQELTNLSEKLSQDFKYTLDIDQKNLDLIDKVEIKNCQVNLKTINYAGVIAQDNYDLTKFNVFKRVIDFKNTKVLAFGGKSIFYHRPFLHFNTQEERESAYKLFKHLARLCKKKDFKKESLVVETQTPTFVGRLPEDTAINSGTVFTENDNVSLALLRGENSFIERLKAIRNAKKSIYMEQLFIRGDEAGKLFSEEVIKKRMEGLDVRVMVTALFNLITNKDFPVDMENATVVLRNMMAAGIRVHGFGCKGYLDNEVRGGDLFRIIRPSHVKNWIIDGEDYNQDTSVSISGGINVSSRYFLLGKRLQWLDQDIGAKGPIVSEMHYGFLRSFYDKEIHYEAETYRDDHICLNPFDPITQRTDYLKFKDAKTQKYKEAEGEAILAEKKYISENIAKILNGESIYGGALRPVKWVNAQGARYILQRPDEGENFLLKTHVDLINSAKNEILIANVFALFVPEMKLALRRAAARGVKIKILTNDPTNDKGNPMVNTLSRYYYRDLVYGNHPHLSKNLDPTLNFSTDQIEINEWNGKLEGETQSDIHIVMHSKFLVIDRTVGLVGSFNMDYASLKNLEQVVLFENQELAQDLAALFEKDLKFSKRLSLERINSFKSPKGSRLILFLGKLLESRL